MQPYNEKQQKNKTCPINFYHDSFLGKTLSNNGNNRTSDNNKAIPQCSLIVTISTEGKCYIINYDNISNILLNGVPLADNEQIELQPGDFLRIDNYQFQVSMLPPLDLTPSSYQKEEQITEPSNTKETKADENLIADKIWDSLQEDFPVLFSASSLLVTETESNKSIQHSSELPTDKPGENLAGNINVQKTTNDPMTLFDNNTVLEYENLLVDTTPSILLAEDSQQSQHLITLSYEKNNDDIENIVIPKIINSIQLEKTNSDALNEVDICQRIPPIIIENILSPLHPIKLAEEVRSTRSMSRWPLPYYHKAILWDYFVKTYHQLIIDTKLSQSTKSINNIQPNK
ncbi:hypothetical protein [Yersinia thracica]|uniref:hypothetical protein n=1 Tax=Yersinia thracica TaxID=2890319 RepID=UPI0011A1F640|nr:hypothetical protein [Yersinia thracica]